MKKYDPGDIATFYFVVVEDDHGKRIKAFSDDKELVKLYMDFHKCKKFRIKKYTGYIEEIYKITDENLHDEIQLFNIITRNREAKKHDEEIMELCIPATHTEINFINSESNSYLASICDYGLLNEVFPYLKEKYKDALRMLFLDDMIRKVIHSKDSKITVNIEFDQLITLYRFFPDHFGA